MGARLPIVTDRSSRVGDSNGTLLLTLRGGTPCNSFATAQSFTAKLFEQLQQNAALGRAPDRS